METGTEHMMEFYLDGVYKDFHLRITHKTIHLFCGVFCICILFLNKLKETLKKLLNKTVYKNQLHFNITAQSYKIKSLKRFYLQRHKNIKCLEIPTKLCNISGQKTIKLLFTAINKTYI